MPSATRWLAAVPLPRRRLQFQMRDLLFWMTLCAVLFAVVHYLSWELLSWLLLAIVGISFGGCLALLIVAGTRGFRTLLQWFWDRIAPLREEQPPADD